MNANDLNLNVNVDVELPDEYLPVLTREYPVPSILNSVLQELPDTEQGDWSAHEIEQIKPALNDLYYQLISKPASSNTLVVNIPRDHLKFYKNWASVSRTLRAAYHELPHSKTRTLLDKIIIPYDLIHQQIRSMIWANTKNES